MIENFAKYMTKSFPKLYKKASTGKISEWIVSVYGGGTEIGNPEPATIQIIHGYVDGAKQTDKIEITKGKNVGRANATTPFEQACSEAQSKWNKQIDRGYTEDPSGESLSLVVLPMLALKFKERKHDIVYPAYCQPKLNGIRCISYMQNGKRMYQSRLGKYWDSMSHLTEDLDKFKGILHTTDGEVYIHGESLQDIGALVKKERKEVDPEIGLKTSDLQYWIYDTIDSTVNFEKRSEKILNAFINAGAEIKYIAEELPSFVLGKLVYVPTVRVDREDEVMLWQSRFLGMGFEGTMVRNDAVYQINKRTKDLQKVKIVLDDEFEIIGGTLVENGREAGTVVFKCKTKDGKEFDVRPKGTLAQRKQYWKDLDKLIGKILTCEFQEWTPDGKPFHCRGVAVRDYE